MGEAFDKKDIVFENGIPHKPTERDAVDIKNLRKESDCPSHLFVRKGEILREYLDATVFVVICEDGNPRKGKPDWHEQGWIPKHWKKWNCPSRLYMISDDSRIMAGYYYKCQECGRDIP